MGNTLTLHRVLKSKINRVYRAFLDADALAKFNPAFGFTCKVHHLDPNVGGTYRMTFTNFTTGQGHSFGGQFVELIENEKIVMTDLFKDTNLPGEMKTTINLKEVSCGTEISISQEGIPDMIPTEMCSLGWQETLIQLAQLVEPEINLKKLCE